MTDKMNFAITNDVEAWGEGATPETVARWQNVCFDKLQELTDVPLELVSSRDIPCWERDEWEDAGLRDEYDFLVFKLQQNWNEWIYQADKESGQLVMD